MQNTLTSLDAPDYSKKWRSFFPIGLSLFTTVLSMTMVFVALSAIADDFEVTLKAVSWVVIIESLVLSSLIMPMGRVGDIFGWKPIHIIGLGLFALGAFSTAFAPSFIALIGARLIMSVGNSMIQSTQTALAIASFPQEEQGKAIGSQSTAVAIGGCCGPLVAGFTLQVLPWEAMFLILVPLSLITMLAALVLIDNSVLKHRQTKTGHKFDWGGALLSAPAVIILITIINNPFNLSFFSFSFIGGLAAVALLLGSFCFWELRSSSPMLELRIFQNRTFATAVGARALGFMAATNIQLLPPILLISVKGLSAGTAGLILVLNFLGMAVASTTAGRLSDRFRPKPFALFGFTLLVISTLWMSFATTDIPISFLMAALIVHGLALGFWNVPNQALLMGSLPQSSLGIGGAFSNLTRNVGNVTGQAIVTVIVVSIMTAEGFDIPLSEIADTKGSGDAFMNGWKIAFWLAAALSAGGLVTTLITKSTSQKKIPVPESSFSTQQSIDETKQSADLSVPKVQTRTILVGVPLILTLILALDWFWMKKNDSDE